MNCEVAKLPAASPHHLCLILSFIWSQGFKVCDWSHWIKHLFPTFALLQHWSTQSQNVHLAHYCWHYDLHAVISSESKRMLTFMPGSHFVWAQPNETDLWGLGWVKMRCCLHTYKHSAGKRGNWIGTAVFSSTGTIHYLNCWFLAVAIVKYETALALWACHFSSDFPLIKQPMWLSAWSSRAPADLECLYMRSRMEQQLTLCMSVCDRAEREQHH